MGEVWFGAKYDELPRISYEVLLVLAAFFAAALHFWRLSYQRVIQPSLQAPPVELGA